MLSEYKGPSNSRDLLKHLVGEKITGAFIFNSHMWITLGSGVSLVLGSGSECVPSYWKESAVDTKRAVERLRNDLNNMLQQIKEAGELPT